MGKLTFAIPTLLGVEGLTADELRRMNMEDVRVENGRVFCQGEPKDIPRLNLRLRTGERVLILLGSFPASTFEELFEGTRKLPWERFIPDGGAFPVKGFSLNSALHSVPACQSIVKKAVATRLGKVYHRETLPETGALYQIQFSIMKNVASLMLDTTGPGLYKRGYRAVGVAAPLRETLAAALVLLSGYRGKDPFCDPFCGSGTIAIEAALIAKNRAPGLNRTFTAQKWPWLSSDAWVEAAGEAMDLEFDGTYDIWGGDIDPAAIRIARDNAVKADVEDLLRFEVADARTFSRTEEYGRIVSNPPYGERLMEKREAEELYRDFGRTVQGLPTGWKINILSSHTEFERTFGRTADKKRKLYNGMLKCDLFQYGGKRGRRT
ncbi:THUMP domain-containing class I SAM-dependent RNA methyltransferase [Evtepia sp.]|uniref:THUMP domain-containing class I SAM-dependent RNA methyltransferase n=1 Tax=Evtepia sp. TaxID=2773933 RepID=UPI003F15CF5E